MTVALNAIRNSTYLIFVHHRYNQYRTVFKETFLKRDLFSNIQSIFKCEIKEKKLILDSGTES